MPGIQVLTDKQEIMKVIKSFQVNTKTFWGACVDSTLPSFSVTKVLQGYIKASMRGVKIFYITEITRDNLPHCEELVQFAVLRHLGCVRGNFDVSDTEHVAGVIHGNILASLLYSNVKELVQQQRHVFDMLWEQA
ncbi:hypothetical protein EHM76_02660 [bacterium]|nr:MAG: hypothetical protein EHM76_02660 [bacterium]